MNEGIVMGFTHTRAVMLFSSVALLLVPGLSPRAIADAKDAEDALPPCHLSTIAESLLSTHNRLHSLEVQYCVSAPTGDPKDPRRFDRHRLVVKDTYRYRDNVHFTTRYPPDCDLNHSVQYFSGKALGTFYVHSRIYEITWEKAATYSFKVLSDGFLDAYGWWPEHDDPLVIRDGKPGMHLRYVVVHPDYTLREGAESVDGHPCYVVENPGKDRLYLDPTIGYALRKREVENAQSGSIGTFLLEGFQRYQLADGTETASLWVPARIRFLASPVAGDGRAKLTDYELQVEDVRLNQADDSVFRFVPPPGTLTQDRDTGKWSCTPGGRDLLDQSVSIAQQSRSIAAGADYASNVVKPPKETYGIMAGLALLVLVNACILVRRCL
jgi:hypothetical protein